LEFEENQVFRIEYTISERGLIRKTGLTRTPCVKELRALTIDRNRFF